MKDLPIRKMVFAVLLLAILLVAWWFVLRPNQAKNAAMLEEISTKQAKLREINQATGLMGDLEKEIRTMEESIAYFQSKLPSEKEIDKVLKEVWLLARRNNLTPTVVKTQERANKQSFVDSQDTNAEQPIEMHLEGDFFGFYSFLQAMENQPRIMRIAQMELTHDDKMPSGQMKATLHLSIFYERNKPVAEKDTKTRS